MTEADTPRHPKATAIRDTGHSDGQGGIWTLLTDPVRYQPRCECGWTTSGFYTWEEARNALDDHRKNPT